MQVWEKPPKPFTSTLHSLSKILMGNPYDSWQKANPFAELWFKSGGHQKSIFHPIKGSTLIQTGQRCISVVFYSIYDLTHHVQIVLDWSSHHNVVLLRSDQIPNKDQQMVRQDPCKNL